MEESQEKYIETSPKTLDIYQHLRLNLRNKFPLCECEGVPDLYCIPCKISVCRKCTFEDHKKHILINRNPVEISPKEVDKDFAETENILNSSEALVNSQETKEKLKTIVEEFSKKLIDKVLKMKKLKMDEIEHMFDGLSENVTTAKENVETVKKALKDYYAKTHKFYNLAKKENKDEFNTLFLLNYDIANLAYLKEQETKQLLENMKEDTNNYQIALELFGKESNEEVQKILFGNNSGESLESKVNHKLTLSTEIKKDIETSDEEYIPINHFKKEIEKIKNQNYKDIADRLGKYTQLMDDFKSKVFNTYINGRTLKGIENELKQYENTSTKGSDTLFSQREEKGAGALTSRSRINTERGAQTTREMGSGKKEGENDKELKGSSTSRSKLQTERNNTLRIPSLTEKEDVILNHDLLKKFYAYLATDLYGKYFKMATQQLQSSHTDLMIKMDEDDDEETEYARIIEGTNTLVIYEKLSNKLTKKQITLSRNPMGYTAFPVGCRCVLIKGKVYISGGKDEKEDYANVLVYDIATEKVKRIMDLNEPRAFHTMVYCDVFETIMVLGGENVNSAEIFDPLANRWQMLPPMNYPRSDIAFHFDKPRGLIFALFGREGNILGGTYSDVIEVLDLAEFHRGWVKVEYYNRSGVGLKKLIKVFPLSNCLLLAYGGETSRKAKKVGVLVNLTKFEITKINREMKEMLYFASQRSKKLRGIVGGLNLEESKSLTIQNNEA